jgi:large subunit ribosomal protein L4
VLLVAPAVDERLRLSARNIPTVDVILADSLNVVDLLRADVVLIEQPALARMEEVYGDRDSGERNATETREEVPA